MKVSIIIPVFNSGNKICRCLESILKQTEKDFQVIVVNDGSTDNTGFLLSAYQKKDQRIIVINKKNGGVSSARNCGLEHATGKYVVFVDSDDYVPEDMLEKMLLSINNNNSDLVMGKMYHVDTNSGNVQKHELKEPLLECSQNTEVQDKLKKILSGYALQKGVAYSSLAKIYRRNIIHEYHIRFDESKSFCEDVLFNISYFRHIGSAEVENDYYYYALDNANSLTKKYQSEMPAVLQEVYLSLICLFLDKGFLDDDLRSCLDRQFLFQIWDLVFRLISNKYENIQKKEKTRYALSILKTEQVAFLMRKYKNTSDICGTSVLGRAASLLYTPNHEMFTIRLLMMCVQIRTLIKKIR